MCQVILVMLARARDRREREARARELRIVEERRQRRLEQERRHQRDMLLRQRHHHHHHHHHNRDLGGLGRDERLQEVIRRELARLDLDDVVSDGVAGVVDVEDEEADEYVIVMAGGEAVDRLEQITEETAVPTEDVKTVITISNNKDDEEKSLKQDEKNLINVEKFNEGIEEATEATEEAVSPSVDDISKIVEKKIQEILVNLEKMNMKISDRERIMEPLEEKHQREMQVESNFKH